MTQDYKQKNFCWCGSEEAIIILEDHQRNFKLLRCHGCGLVRVSPVPDYSPKRYAAYSVENYLKNKKIYVSFMADLLKQVLNHKRSGNFLEIGCGVGYLLELAKSQGFIVSGIELSQREAAIANEILHEEKVKVASLEESAYPEKYFDVVAMNHVLEHIADLKSLLKEIKRILKDDGVVVIGSPNFGGWYAKIRKTRWPGLKPNQHLWQFEPKTIIKVLSDNGFNVVNLKLQAPHKIRSLFRYNGMKNLLLMKLNIILGALGQGDNMLVTAKKNV